MKNKLQHIVDNLKNQSELMSLEEVNTMIKTAPHADVPSKKFNLKSNYIIITIMTTLSILITTLFGFFQNSIESNTESNHKEFSIIAMDTIIPSENYIDEGIKEVKSHLSSTKNGTKNAQKGIPTAKTYSQNHFYTPELNAISDNKSKDWISDTPQIKESIISHEKNNETLSSLQLQEMEVKSYLDSMGLLILSDEELKKFHIYRLENYLFFSVGDSAKFWDEAWVNNSYSKAANSWFLNSSQKDEKPELRLHIGVKNNLKHQKNEKWQNLIPIAAYMPSEPYRCVVFYFPKTEKNLSKLSTEQRTRLKAIDPNILGNDSTFGKYLKSEYPLDQGCFSNEDKKDYLMPNKEQLVLADHNLRKSLKIYIKPDKLYYQKYAFPKHFVSLEFKEHYTGTNCSGDFFNSNRMKNTPPSFITKMEKNYFDIYELSSKNLQRENADQYFYINKHKMLVVYVGSFLGQDVYFWYENHHRLLELVHDSTRKKFETYLGLVKTLEMPILKSKSNSFIPYHYHYRQFLQKGNLAIPTISLDFETLKTLGIENDGKKVSFTLPISEQMNLKMDFYKDVSMVEFKETGAQTPYVLPVLVSDGVGNFQRLLLDTTKKIDYETLIPVLVQTGQQFTFNDQVNLHWHPDCIFWYEPNPAFLSLLPDSIAKQLQKELNRAQQKHDLWKVESISENIISDEQCVYLPLCEDEQVTLLDMHLYPNPASNHLTFTLLTEKPMQISGYYILSTLNGAELARGNYQTEKKFQIDLPQVASGIYLFTIVTESGDKFTRRLVIKQ